MNHLIIYTHLNPKSFTKAISDRLEKVSAEKGDNIQVIDLYADKFNPVLQFPDIEHAFMGKAAPLDIVDYQKQIKWADHITLVYPLWWGQMPAILKGFIDRVFSNGFAFSYTEERPKGLLNGKTAQLYICTGSPSDIYEQTGMHKALNRINDDGIFAFCGIKAKSEFFGNVTQGTDALRTSYLDSIK